MSKKRQKAPLEKQLERLASQRWSYRGVRTLLQATCLGLSFWSLGLGAHLLFGWSLDYTLLKALVLAGIALGAVMLLRPRVPVDEVARRLDKRYGLQEQIVTALEVNERGESEGIAAYLVSKARHNTAQVQRYSAMRQRFPWPEVIALAALLLLAGGMMLLVSIRLPSIAESEPLPLPPLAQPGDPPQEFPMEPFDPPRSSNPQAATGQEQTEQQQQVQPATLSGGDQQSMTALADALRDMSVTRSASEALDRGDTSGAAQSLREVADQAEQLSPETRRDIANALRNAADQIGVNDPDLATQLRNNAHEMEQEPQDAAEALDDLAEAIEDLGQPDEQAEPQEGQLAQQPPQSEQPQDWNDQAQGQPEAGNDTPPRDRRERSRPHERLGIEGVPLELEGDDTGESSSDSGSEAQDDAQLGEGRFEQDDRRPADTRVQVGEDPLRIPADLRDVVQEYFSPSQ
jgi:hypothetical protein